MLRHTALFLHRDTITPEQQTDMLKGLAYMRFECAGVRALDYGNDLFGGSAPLREVPPGAPRPRWREPQAGPPCNYDTALHLDFDDQAGLDAYTNDEVHRQVAAFNAGVSRAELTARVDWWYEGEPLTIRGEIRHIAMFVWTHDAGEVARRRALDAVRHLENADGVESVTVGENVGTGTTVFDWILDVQVSDQDAAKRLLSGEHYRETMLAIAPATRFEWTARLSHTMRGL
jgi:hypothetical protein